jgi:hypothetical protein
MSGRIRPLPHPTGDQAAQPRFALALIVELVRERPDVATRAPDW